MFFPFFFYFFVSLFFYIFCCCFFFFFVFNIHFGSFVACFEHFTRFFRLRTKSMKLHCHWSQSFSRKQKKNDPFELFFLHFFLLHFNINEFFHSPEKYLLFFFFFILFIPSAHTHILHVFIFFAFSVIIAHFVSFSSFISRANVDGWANIKCLIFVYFILETVTISSAHHFLFCLSFWGTNKKENESILTKCTFADTFKEDKKGKEKQKKKKSKIEKDKCALKKRSPPFHFIWNFFFSVASSFFVSFGKIKFKGIACVERSKFH